MYDLDLMLVKTDSLIWKICLSINHNLNQPKHFNKYCLVLSQLIYNQWLKMYNCSANGFDINMNNVDNWFS